MTVTVLSEENFLDIVVLYEEGMLGEEDTMELFQFLVNSGHAWTLPGWYGRTAEWLISEGLIEKPKTKGKKGE